VATINGYQQGAEAPLTADFEIARVLEEVPGGM
jgi:hypothetical protein